VLRACLGPVERKGGRYLFRYELLYVTVTGRTTRRMRRRAGAAPRFPMDSLSSGWDTLFSILHSQFVSSTVT
jgi:hypothetical protein